MTETTTTPTTPTTTTSATEATFTLDEQVLRTVLSTGPRPDRPGPLSASLTFAWRALLKIKHVPEQLFDVTMFPIMFLLLFTYLFGGALAGSPKEYLQDVLPGILVMTTSMITMYTGMTLNTDIQKKVFDRFQSLPVWRPAVLVGALLTDVLRYLMASMVMLVLGIALGFRPDGGPLGVVAALALLIVFCFGLSWVWTSIGLIARTPESVMYMSMMVLFPLTFTSNVFVEPDTMPGWLQAFVDVNPITRLVTAARGLMHGHAEFGEIAWVLIAAALLAAVFAPLTMRLYARER